LRGRLIATFFDGWFLLWHDSGLGNGGIFRGIQDYFKAGANTPIADCYITSACDYFLYFSLIFVAEITMPNSILLHHSSPP
jgi:hypothetical protein